MSQKIKDRVEEKRVEITSNIFDSISSFLFMKRANSMVHDRCHLIYSFVTAKFANEDDLSVFFQREKAFLIQEKLASIARQDHENVFAVRKMLKSLESQ
jgi:hypothetical protein